MADYNFDKLVGEAGMKSSYRNQVDEALTMTEAEKVLQGLSIRFSITDGYKVDGGGQFDYVFNLVKKTWERTDWRSGIPLTSSGSLKDDSIKKFINAAAFVLTLKQKHFVTNTKSLEINTDAFEKEKYGPIKRLTRCELRMDDRFFRWVPESDRDSPFPELYEALQELRNSTGF